MFCGYRVGRVIERGYSDTVLGRVVDRGFLDIVFGRAVDGLFGYCVGPCGRAGFV